MGTHLGMDWSQEEADVVDVKDSERSFFVRLDRNACDIGKAAEVFGNGKVVTVDQLPEEYGFITPVMSEKDFAEKASSIDGIISRIRVEA